MQKFVTSLMFVGEQNGKAEEAMKLYTSLFPNSKYEVLMRYEKEEREIEGGVKFARFTLNGQEFSAMESGQDHKFTFTPAISITVTCDSEEEIDTVYKALSEGGEELMPLDNYGFSKKFGWVNDRFGVSWQISLP